MHLLPQRSQPAPRYLPAVSAQMVCNVVCRAFFVYHYVVAMRKNAERVALPIMQGLSEALHRFDAETASKSHGYLR